jgi:TolA-binding protein
MKRDAPVHPRLFAEIGAEQDQALVEDAILPPVRARIVLRELERAGRAAEASKVRARLAPHRWPALPALVGAFAVGVASCLFFLRPRAMDFQIGTRGQTGHAGVTLAASAQQELPLQFSDGSEIVLTAGAEGNVSRLSEEGAEVTLTRGELRAHVQHRPGSRWMVRAGPYGVMVTGTRFVVRWQPRSHIFAVELQEGSVMVEGGRLSSRVTLTAGESLRIGDVTDSPSAPRDVGATRPRGEAQAPVEGIEAVAAAPAGAHSHRDKHVNDAVVAPAPRGLALGPTELLSLADEARHAGARAQARRALNTLINGFPKHELAADAVFGLGRMAAEDGDAPAAARLFRTYLRRWPRGPMAEAASGRLLEATVKQGHAPQIARQARAYLLRFPDGAQAELARQVQR